MYFFPCRPVQERPACGPPLVLSRISAGFPSPADDYIERNLDLNDYLVRRPAATFFVRVQGDSMIQAGIHDGDILIVDRSREPADGKVVIAVLNGEMTVKRLRRCGDRLVLMPENQRHEPIEIGAGSDFTVWGVVVWAIHEVR